MNFDAICDDIITSIPGVRFSIILDKFGHKVAGGMKDNVESMLTEDEVKMALFHAGQRWETRKHLTHKIGHPKYSMTEYEKVKRFTFQVETHLLMVSTELSTDNSVISEIQSLIEKYSK